MIDLIVKISGSIFVAGISLIMLVIGLSTIVIMFEELLDRYKR